jgi:hypothetical protein
MGPILPNGPYRCGAAGWILLLPVIVALILLVVD